jgi:hypothetical protein
MGQKIVGQKTAQKWTKNNPKKQFQGIYPKISKQQAPPPPPTQHTVHGANHTKNITHTQHEF